MYVHVCMETIVFILHLHPYYYTILLYQRSPAITVAGADDTIHIPVCAEHSGWQQVRHEGADNAWSKSLVENAADIVGPASSIMFS